MQSRSQKQVQVGGDDDGSYDFHLLKVNSEPECENFIIKTNRKVLSHCYSVSTTLWMHTIWTNATVCTMQEVLGGEKSTPEDPPHLNLTVIRHWFEFFFSFLISG